MVQLEFACAYHRLCGQRVLFPQGFHCTGMPIKACADKLVNEISMFGRDFQGYKAEESVVEEKPAAEAKPAAKEDPTKFKATKGKTAAKTVKMKYQFQIMQAIGIPSQEIHKFADPQYWLYVSLSSSTDMACANSSS